MAIKYINIFQSMLGPPKFTRIGIFGLKTNHLATLGHMPTFRKAYITFLLTIRMTITVT
jgi:hypothetical protein